MKDITFIHMWTKKSGSSYTFNGKRLNSYVGYELTNYLQTFIEYSNFFRNEVSKITEINADKSGFIDTYFIKELSDHNLFSLNDQIQKTSPGTKRYVWFNTGRTAIKLY